MPKGIFSYPEERSKKISKSRAGKPHPHTGYELSKEARKKIAN